MAAQLSIEYAAEEQLRIAALHAAARINNDGSQNTVIFDAEKFLEFLHAGETYEGR